MHPFQVDAISSSLRWILKQVNYVLHLLYAQLQRQLKVNYENFSEASTRKSTMQSEKSELKKTFHQRMVRGAVKIRS